MRTLCLLLCLLVSVAAIPAVFAQTCTLCHGSGSDPAPPVDTQGNSATTFTGVGAHQSHLATSTWHAQVACTECHIVPAQPSDPGHYDTALPAELTWGALATADGAVPVWDGATCSNVYCHGATLIGGGATPTWTSVGSGQASCGTCHSLPPGAPHAQDFNCYTCHPDIDAGFSFVTPEQHIDGVVTLDPATSVPEALPGRFVFGPVTPNPFNPTASIRYVVPRPADVTITVYDAAGRRLATLADGHHGAGEYAAAWNGTDRNGEDVPSGIYFARIEAGDFRTTEKMILLR